MLEEITISFLNFLKIISQENFFLKKLFLEEFENPGCYFLQREWVTFYPNWGEKGF